MFLRPTGDLEKQMTKVVAPKTSDILDMYRTLIPVNEVSQKK
jgi:hypothetical protein